ncbi:hypothetical protein HYQ45_012399 [Verticillium longisporum]|uniref:LPXTG-domain-containing protein n=1 Tax=Verticillium longisporum TaxID=100787 RepID=A0A8I2ZE32_VERLO|nr:hypothetical protein HYQ45_012399 [Verticillium longisporum]
MRFAVSAFWLGLWLSRASALKAVAGSPCQTLCGNVLGSTSSDELVCKEEDYDTSAEGGVFERCTTCQLASGYIDGDETDTQWALYNLRYAVSYCLFGYPENEDVGSSPCLTSTACEPLQRAVTYNELEPNGTAYGYCSTWIHDQLPRCASCLRAGSNHFLANFMTVLQAGCEQMPINGTRVSIDSPPFITSVVNITDPTPIATNIPNYYPGPLSLDARVGIAFGALLLILVAVGFCIICNGRRKRRTFLRSYDEKVKKAMAAWPTPINTTRGEYFESPSSQHPFRGWDDTPQSQKPLRDWDNSPQSVSTEKFQTRYFSPYSSQYNSPDTAVDGRNMPWPADKPQMRTAPQEVGIALGGPEPSPVWQQDTKGKAVGEESYELREVDGNYGQHLAPALDVQPIHQPERPVYAQYNPADYHDSPQDDPRKAYVW